MLELPVIRFFIGFISKNFIMNQNDSFEIRLAVEVNSLLNEK